MANFARFKATPLLSPRRKPKMTGRTLSNSSTHSQSSHQGGFFDDWEEHVSATAPASPIDRSTWTMSEEGDQVRQFSNSFTSKPCSPRPQTRPIQIELPSYKSSKFSTSTGFSVRTPPEPLSARGDILGGYFPFHEDPKGQVRRTHPFYQEPQNSQNKVPALRLEPSSLLQDCSSPQPPPPLPMAFTDTPVTSYFPHGVSDHALPIGKYYPSNYEARNGPHSARSSFHGRQNASSPDLHSPSLVPTGKISEAESDRRIRQYQRDIVAQAAMVLAGQDKVRGGITPKPLPVHDLRFHLGNHRPLSPRLVPLGSPGPVTPIDLGSSASGNAERGRISGSSSMTPNPLSPAGQALI